MPSRDGFLELLLWLPIQIAKYLLEPVTVTADVFAEMTNQAVDDYLKEHPLG